MKHIPIAIFICLCIGCVNVERLAKQLSAEKGVFYVEVPTWRGPIRVGMANPVLGVSGSVFTNGGLTLTVPANIGMSVQYHQYLPATNSPTPVKP